MVDERTAFKGIGNHYFFQFALLQIHLYRRYLYFPGRPEKQFFCTQISFLLHNLYRYSRKYLNYFKRFLEYFFIIFSSSFCCFSCFLKKKILKTWKPLEISYILGKIISMPFNNLSFCRIFCAIWSLNDF